MTIQDLLTELHDAGIRLRRDGGELVVAGSKRKLGASLVGAMRAHKALLLDLVDRAGDVWIGSDGGGVSRLRDGVFTHFTTRDGLTSNEVVAVLEDRAGTLWVGTLGGGLNRIAGGRITAINLNTGDLAWTVANGEAPDWIKNHPALEGVQLPRTGRYEHVGLMVTKSLLFAGEGSGLFAVPPGSGGPMFRAHDKKTGDIIAEFKLPANQSGIPMTYLAGGKQFIVVAVGAIGTPAEFVALTVE